MTARARLDGPVVLEVVEAERGRPELLLCGHDRAAERWWPELVPCVLAYERAIAHAFSSTSGAQDWPDRVPVRAAAEVWVPFDAFAQRIDECMAGGR